MRAVIQRVSRASVDVDNETIGSIERGFLVLLGVADEDTEEEQTQEEIVNNNGEITEEDNG